MQPNREVSVEVTTTHGAGKVHSVVVARSGIVTHQTHDAQEKRSFEIKFKALPSMMPSASLIVYYIQPSGELIFNHMDLNFDQFSPNYVSWENNFFIL